VRVALERSPRHRLLGECEIQIVDGFVDLGSVLVADRNAIDAGVFEGEAHCRSAVLTVERAFSREFHADYAHAFFADLLDVGDDFWDIAQTFGVVILGIHSDALVIHANHGDIEPLVSGELAQGRKAVNGGAVTYDGFPGLSLENSILPPARVCGPCGGMLPVQEHDVEVFGIRELAELVEFLLRIHTLVGGDFRHQAIAIAWNALQGYAEHPVHVAVGLGSFEEANAAVVSVAHQPGKAVLAEVALYLAAEAASAEGEARDLHSRLSQPYPICGGLARGAQWEGAGDGEGAGGQSGFEEFTSGVVRHGSTSNVANESASGMERRCRLNGRPLAFQMP
jgi:hypothetical protein